MAYLALDLSKRSAGWALWHRGLERPLAGTWALGDECTSPGRAFGRLHRSLDELHRTMALKTIAYEKPLNLGHGSAQTSEETLFILIGLAAHVDSFCAARGVRHCHGVHQATWRRHFLGKMKRGTRSAALKDMALERCRELGMTPGRHDAAEACGILDYVLSLDHVVPPWRALDAAA